MAEYTNVNSSNSYRSRGKPEFIYLFVARICGEMNPIKLPCQQMKQDELAGKIFDSELELASAVIHGVEVKGERGNYRTQSVKFNFNHGS